MSTPSKNPNEPPKKPSFWEKLSERGTSKEDSSLVSAIVRQAKKEADNSSDEKVVKNSEIEGNEKKIAHSRLSTAGTLLGFVIILVAGFWVYFMAMLHESNYLHEKFDKENLTTELNRKTALFQQAQTDVQDVKKFNKLLQVEDLANRILTLDLEHPILNYKRPEGERVIPSKGSTNILLKTMNDAGEIVYLSENEVLSLEKAKEVRVETARVILEKIISQAANLDNAINTGDKIKKQLDALFTEISAIDPSEDNFPSAVLKSHFAATRSAANAILKDVKSANLNNLVSDIKKQINLIDVSGFDEATSSTIASIKTILTKLSSQGSSFKKALNEINSLDITKISDNNLYQKVVQIVGDRRAKNDDSDLATAAIITNNLGRINTINDLRSRRISWSTVIERAEKIVRLGADLTRDTDGTPTDASRDIDPNNTLATLISYSGKSSKEQIEIRGSALGKEAYDTRTFTLVADLIDALEGSKYFKDVSGFAFTREENRQGDISSPINFQLSLQDPATIDERDISIEIVKTAAKTIDEDGIINTEEIQNLEFNFAGTDGEDTSEDSEEPVGIFDVLSTTLNN